MRSQQSSPATIQKHVRCARCNSRLFARTVRIEAFTVEILDQDMQLNDIKPPEQMRTVQRFSDLNCWVCGCKAVVSLTGS